MLSVNDLDPHAKTLLFYKAKGTKSTEKKVCLYVQTNIRSNEVIFLVEKEGMQIGKFGNIKTAVEVFNQVEGI